MTSCAMTNYKRRVFTDGEMTVFDVDRETMKAPVQIDKKESVNLPEGWKRNWLESWSEG